MKRLEFVRKMRGARCQAKTSDEAIMFLAQIARERRRLEQERVCLLRRLGQIDLRIGEIGISENRIAPAIKVATPCLSETSERKIAMEPRVLSRLNEVTLRY